MNLKDELSPLCESNSYPIEWYTTSYYHPCMDQYYLPGKTELLPYVD
jgi:hypothetical protein